jgi:hypothetical protein
MGYITGFLKFWYDFIVGDDWTVAVGVVIALILTAALAHNGVTAWWLMPLAAVALLAASLFRATRA